MVNWWESLTTLQQIFAVFGISATLLLILQTVILLFGLGDNGEVDADGDFEADADFNVDTDASDGLGAYDSDGFEAHDGSDGLHDPGLRVFTVRGLVAFFAVAGWLGVVLLGAGMPPVLACLLAIIGGGITLFLTAYALRAALKLQQNGILQIENAIGQRAQVYMPVPPNLQGQGKINIMIQDRYAELEACTNADHTLPTNSWVIVRDVIGRSVLLVEPDPSHAKISKVL